MEKKRFRADILIIAGLVLAGLVLGLVLLLTKKEGKTVEIRVSGELVESIPIDRDGSYDIHGLYGTNVLVIRDGKAHMEEASCPDGICKGMGEIDSAAQAIICLPNEIVVEIADPDSTPGGADDSVPDVVAGGRQ